MFQVILDRLPQREGDGVPPPLELALDAGMLQPVHDSEYHHGRHDPDQEADGHRHVAPQGPRLRSRSSQEGHPQEHEGRRGRKRHRDDRLPVEQRRVVGISQQHHHADRHDPSGQTAGQIVSPIPSCR